MTYPADDAEFIESKITKVNKNEDGTFDITDERGLGLWCGKDCPIKPREGMAARFYGRGIGSPVRGLFIDGVKVWYRTEAEDQEHHEIMLYGADAADWLRRWDEGKVVWSIEMGGIGPGYEQCIHVTAAEVLRHMLAMKYDHSQWSDGDAWKKDLKTIEAEGFKNETIVKLGLSGAQWGAAVNVAANLYQRGPRAMMNDPRVKDRHIQVSRGFP